MLGFVLAGLARHIVGYAIGAAVATVAISICVRYLNKSKAQEEMRRKNVNKATVRDIVKDPSVTHIKLDGLDSDGNEVKIDIETDDYDADEIKRGTVIYA